MTGTRLILSLLTISAALLASSVSHASFYDGYKLKEFADADDRIDAGNSQTTDYSASARLSGFVLGVHDSVDGILVCAPSGVRAGQLVGIVKKYVREHPDKWNLPATTLVINALSSTFPCKK